MDRTSATASIVTLAVSAWLHAAPLRADPLRAGILPAAGDPTLAASLDRELGRAVAERGVRSVLGPTELAAQLGSAPGVASALQEAGALLDRSARSALYMKRGESVDLARQALRKLEGTLAIHHARVVLARAQSALARALLLKPADEAGARDAFRAAIAASPDFRGESLPPRAAQLLEEARREARVVAPAAEDLGKIATRARLGAVLWIAVRPAESSRVDLELICFFEREKASRAPLRKSGRIEDATSLAAELVARVLRPPAASAPASRPLPATLPAPDPRPRPRPAPAAPSLWYKKWWVWTIAGVVVGAGLGVGLGLGLRSKGSPRGLDFEFIY
jgi:hypothetical protein